VLVSQCQTLNNGIFGEVDRSASEGVVLELITSKCTPILMYGLEVSYVTKADISSLDFAVTRFLMKLFETNNTNIIEECIAYFNFNLPSNLLANIIELFHAQYRKCGSMFVCLFVYLTNK
jgi:hypothetical protein